MDLSVCNRSWPRVSASRPRALSTLDSRTDAPVCSSAHNYTKLHKPTQTCGESVDQSPRTSWTISLANSSDLCQYFSASACDSCQLRCGSEDWIVVESDESRSPEPAFAVEPSAAAAPSFGPPSPAEAEPFNVQCSNKDAVWTMRPVGGICGHIVAEVTTSDGAVLRSTSLLCAHCRASLQYTVFG